MNEPSCAYCGEPTEDYEYTGKHGTRKTYICGQRECQKWLRDEDRREYDDERQRLDEDWWF